jgi:NAD(P)-dependent dehydrogenase (short-subunit alcohol dehydrogenase family)
VAEGAKVVISDTDTARGAELAESLGANARFLKTDVSRDADIQAAIAQGN